MIQLNSAAQRSSLTIQVVHVVAQLLANPCLTDSQPTNLSAENTTLPDYSDQYCALDIAKNEVSVFEAS